MGWKKKYFVLQVLQLYCKSEGWTAIVVKNYIAIQFLYCREEGFSRLGLYCNTRNCIAMMLAMGWRFCIARLSCWGFKCIAREGDCIATGMCNG